MECNSINKLKHTPTWALISMESPIFHNLLLPLQKVAMEQLWRMHSCILPGEAYSSSDLLCRITWMLIWGWQAKPGTHCVFCSLCKYYCALKQISVFFYMCDIAEPSSVADKGTLGIKQNPPWSLIMSAKIQIWFYPGKPSQWLSPVLH